ncbi:MAG: hypothetical protein K0R59_2434 [Sphingobacterium sp.]|jgi:hypothetical protein|uniref:hypothetical protein n=1 Tax=Sphingobacterium sp. NGMCC 1.201703 TaxID=3388657 RepID=UPI002A67792F|nr:hypothetical protein [Sphingobacterium sp.]
MKREFIAIAVFSICLLSCAKDEIKSSKIDQVESFANENIEKEKFAIILSKAVSSNQSMRNFIQEEALKMMDNDYDVFYPFIKDEILDNNLSFRDNLLKVTDQETLNRIESQLPLLTIYVPTLPSGFSPETWRSKSEIPAVVAEGNYKNNELAFFQNGEEKIKIKANQIPGFPTLVVKNNERIVVKNKALLASSGSSQNVKRNYQFISSEFENKGIWSGVAKAANKRDLNISKKANSTSLTGVTWGPRLTSIGLTTDELNASGLADIMVSKGAVGNDKGADNWQRDFVYYSLTPSNTTGKLRTNFKEFIHYISISESGFNLMTNTNSDPDDPILTRTKVGSPNFWSDGYFELRFDVVSNAKDGVGERFMDVRSIKPQDLFDIEYALVAGSVYDIKKIVPKFAKVDIPLQAWDLANLTYGWKISVSELDQASSSTVSTTNTSKFATNFGLDKTKIGLKFGISAEISSSKTHSYTVQNVTDELGDVLVYFGDHVYDKMEPVYANGLINIYYYFNTSYNSNISLLVAPKRIN